ncbi:uncharacterized protein MONOS_3772 [Monocercomonoides exilis]|uniref:uncharacterized protein n=1 Tax=Monocercomonoides exilis TaxID=2049356 RepID=UPI00355982A9|nr:hypothetical protein MONOS_3772 [Monocercomonoides exilis]|eukprot:MONOS_3772.1-p1 / transcript=MONOS_3772.1 / gene=MONOS_3772 / organism=Monocercomonoides_exilis_PA203 / gene_product=unspecified product / transcript_product=unspecified product / location=Mono_scaffold00092:30642-31356(-) / protein_length=184 / sequence_SO=supercontig / SO=protein_coding / is_pseudo=false
MIAHIVHDNVVRLVDGVKYGGISKKSLEHAGKAIKNGRHIAKVGHPPIISGEKEKQFLEEVAIESRSGSSLSLRKARDLLPKQVDINRLAASCQKVLKPWNTEFHSFHDANKYPEEIIFNIDESSLHIPTSTRGVVVHPADEQSWFKKLPNGCRMPLSLLESLLMASRFRLSCCGRVQIFRKN